MTKAFLPRPNSGHVRPLLALDRTTLSRCVAFITGHNNLRYHRSLHDPDTPSGCRFCAMSPETAAHLYANCPRFLGLRFDLSGLLYLHHLPDSWSVDRMVSFLSHAPISAAMDDAHILPFVIEHDWSDVDPDPPDTGSSSSLASMSDD